MSKRPIFDDKDPLTHSSISPAFAAASVESNEVISKKPRESSLIPKFPAIPESDDWSELKDDDGLKYERTLPKKSLK
jgi:hypothetical protein